MSKPRSSSADLREERDGPTTSSGRTEGEGSSPIVDLLDRFRADLAPFLPAGATLLVAVSGGPDSVALLLLAHTLLGERCVAATVDHGLRETSAAEAAWVAGLCAERGIRHLTLAGDLPQRTGRTANVSARARTLRYRLLEDARVALGAAAITTGHHADDQLETLMMRLNRGAGVGGLSGVRARSGTVIRPLLGWRRAELAALVAAAGIVPVADPTNVDDRFDRARLRRSLAGAGWLDPLGASASAAALADADVALEWSVDRLAESCCTWGEASVHVELPAGLPFELRRRLLRRAIKDVQPGLELRGAALARAARTLAEGKPAMLGDVALTPERDGQGAPVWHVRRAPPRRSP